MKNDILIVKEYYLCKLHNEVFEVAESRINTECFLPTWEGVSYEDPFLILRFVFPPYMGGCIDPDRSGQPTDRVSSLHGRVYQD